MQHIALGFAKLHEVPIGPFHKFVHVPQIASQPLAVSTAPLQPGGQKFVESELNTTVYIIDEDI